MGITAIEELNSRPMRRLAVAVILDAINEAKQRPKSENGKKAYFFLTGENGMLQEWLECLNGIDSEVITKGIKKLLIDNFKIQPPKKKRRKCQPNIGIKYSGRMISVQKAADILGFSYSTVYRRHELYPSYSLAELRKVMPAKRNGKVIKGRPKNNG